MNITERSMNITGTWRFPKVWILLVLERWTWKFCRGIKWQIMDILAAIQKTARATALEIKSNVSAIKHRMLSTQWKAPRYAWGPVTKEAVEMFSQNATIVD